jgi:nicotinamidase-related amidase
MNNNTLLLIDIQKEYNTPGRPYFLNGIDTSLKYAKFMLDFARKNQWEIIHVKHLQEGELFSKDKSHSEFVEGFEPSADEKIFEKSNFSCFTSCNFTKYMENHINKNIYVAGYGSTMCCLSTIIEGYHRGFKMNFIQDASLAKAAGGRSEQELHEAANIIIAPFASTVTTSSFVD